MSILRLLKNILHALKFYIWTKIKISYRLVTFISEFTGDA